VGLQALLQKILVHHLKNDDNKKTTNTKLPSIPVSLLLLSLLGKYKTCFGSLSHSYFPIADPLPLLCQVLFYLNITRLTYYFSEKQQKVVLCGVWRRSPTTE